MGGAMDLDAYIKLASPVVAIALYVAGRLFQDKSKVISWMDLGASFTLGDPDADGSRLHTHRIVLKNTGRGSAKNLRLGHLYFPEKIDVTPAVQYTITKNPDGHVELLFPTLVPGESITVSYLYFAPRIAAEINTYAKSDEGAVRIVTALPTPLPSMKVVRLLQFLAFTGACFLIYWLLRLSIYVANHPFPAI